MTSRLLMLALSLWFAAMSRAALHQTGLVGEGPTLRVLRLPPLSLLLELAALPVDSRELVRWDAGPIRVLVLILATGVAIFAVAAFYGFVVG